MGDTISFFFISLLRFAFAGEMPPELVSLLADLSKEFFG